MRKHHRLSNYLAKVNSNKTNPILFLRKQLSTIHCLKNAQQATMIISDKSGRQIKRVALDNTQKGQLIIQAKELNAGIYTYTLMVDGKVFASKQMVLTN